MEQGDDHLGLCPHHGRLQRRDEPAALRRRGTTVRHRSATAARRVLGLDPRHSDPYSVGDRQWMSRFDNWPKPAAPIAQSAAMIEDFAELHAAREEADAGISAWAAKVDEAWLGEDMTWFSGAANRQISAPKRLLVAHFFNHQTHHRGQAHAMLTAAGQQTGDTDLFLLIPQIIG